MKKPTLMNPKRAGRPAKVDRGIRHISREKIAKLTALHLTIKVRANKADIKNKRLLKALHHAIKRARLKGLRVIHYTLEYNHVHLLVEARNNKVLHQGMQAFGISFSKAVNRIKAVCGHVYKHRYYLRKLSSRKDVKIVMHYIFRNGVKHKRALSIFDPYNSLPAEKRISADIKKVIDKSEFLSRLRVDLQQVLDEGSLFYMDAKFLWG